MQRINKPNNLLQQANKLHPAVQWFSHSSTHSFTHQNIRCFITQQQNGGKAYNYDIMMLEHATRSFCFLKYLFVHWAYIITCFINLVNTWPAVACCIIFLHCNGLFVWLEVYGYRWRKTWVKLLCAYLHITYMLPPHTGFVNSVSNSLTYLNLLGHIPIWEFPHGFMRFKSLQQPEQNRDAGLCQYDANLFEAFEDFIAAAARLYCCSSTPLSLQQHAFIAAAARLYTVTDLSLFGTQKYKANAWFGAITSSAQQQVAAMHTEKQQPCMLSRSFKAQLAWLWVDVLSRLQLIFYTTLWGIVNPQYIRYCQANGVLHHVKHVLPDVW